MNNILKAVEIKKNYIDGERVLEVLCGVNLELNKGDCIAIMGASGAGKSTLLHILGGLDFPTDGSVIANEIDLKNISENQLAEYRNKKIGFVFQFHHLLPEFSALENVFLPSMISGDKRETIINRAKILLSQVGLGDRLNHLPSQLSGGEQQRVAIARALMNNPDIILADEPTGNLDEKTSDAVMNDLINIIRTNQKSLIIVTHEHKIAEMMDKIFLLKDGVLTLIKENTKGVTL